jgi:hypothetical protein
MTNKNFIINIPREYLQVMAFFSLGIIRMDNYRMGSVGTAAKISCRDHIIRLAEHNN